VEKRREEALNRLSELSDTITVKEAQHVLGHSNQTTTNRILHQFNSMKFQPLGTKRKQITVSQDELEEFIRTCTPKGTRWHKN